MRSIFDRTFKPTPEEEMEGLEKYRGILERSYQEKWCSTCSNYIPVPVDLPGVVTAYPECKIGNLATKTCLFYNVDEDERKKEMAHLDDWMAKIKDRMRKER